MALYSDGIIFKFRFQKSRFTPKNRDRADTFSSHCNLEIVIESNGVFHESFLCNITFVVWRM